ncbi:uncharacterized protein [Asterias amurensis]|uniref:uncharacterized protein isoform X2 n=1 Tax=Asterias amurensis TaxID=7602 RepID=UPI003AB54685
MNGQGHDDDARSHVGNTASFEDLEGMMSSQSFEGDDPDLPLDAFSGLQPPKLSVLSQDENHSILLGDYLTNESLGEILQLDGEHETSGLLNDSELLNHRGQYDSGSNLPSEDDFSEDGQHLGNGSSTGLLQMYMQATPRADTSVVDLNYASDGLNDGSFGYSDDVFNHPEHFYKNNNDEHYLEGSPLEQSDQHEKAAEIFTKFEDVDHRRMASGFENDRRSSLESDILSEGTSMELNKTVVTANGFHENLQAGAAEESYSVDPTDGKDSDSASMSLGQFVPNAVNRNRLPRPASKPLKRSTPKTNEDEASEHKGTPKGSLSASIPRSARSSTRNSPRVSGTSSQRSHRSPRYSQRSEDLTDRSSHRHSNGTDSRNQRNSSSSKRPNGVPRLNLRRDSDASSVNISLSSDPSKFDLSLRLQEESRTRRHADELVGQLQKNYDDLLGKYAQAENTIDQLKLGARVSLYSDGPAPGQSLQGSFSPAQKPGMVNFNQPQQATVHHIMSSSSHTSGGPLGGPQTIQTGHSTMGIQTNNNNIGPSGTSTLEKAERGEIGFPAEEGVLMALAFQAKGLQEQVDSFGMLLQGNQIEPSEQKNVLDRLKSDQGKLEAEYMHAKEEHNAFRRRNSLLSGGGDMTFDPDRAIEGEIFQLGMKLEDVAEIVQNNLRNNPLPTISPPHRQQSQESSNESRELEERLHQELERELERQFQKNSRHIEERSSHEDQDQDQQDGVEREETDQSHHSGYSSNSPQASQDSHHGAPSLFSPPQPTRQPHATGDDRNSRRNTPEDVSGGKRHSKQSQLPRPKSLTNTTNKNFGKDPITIRKPSLRNEQHGPSDFQHYPLGQSEHTTRGDGSRQKLPENGFMSPEADSGFMGSESSRQSNQNGGAGYDGRNQLRKPRESVRQSLRSSKLPLGQRSPPQVIRRLPGGDWESPQFSDYDISERDEEIEEESLRSSRAVKKSTDKTPLLRSTSQANRRSSTEKQKPRPAANPTPVHSSGIQQRKQQPGHQNSRDRQPHLERPSHRRETPHKSLRNPHPAWTHYQDGSHQEPSSNASPKKSQSTSRLRLENPVSNPIKSRPISRQPYIPSVPLQPRRVYDSMSDVTRSSGKSEAIRDLQEEIERMKSQMEKMNTLEKTTRPLVKDTYPRRPSVRKDRLDSVGSDVGERRSEILAALQNEIAHLRDQIHEQNKSPLGVNDSPLSRESLRRTRREPRQESRQDDFEDRIVTDSLPPPRSILRETLRQQYLPRSFPEPRTPTQSTLPTGSPYRPRLRNQPPQFESTPYRSSPSYIPETSSYPESPSWARPSLHPSHFASPSMRVSPGSHSASRSEPCPMCSGTGVHTHGEYSYPGDFVGPSVTDPPQTSGLGQYEQRNPSGANQFQTQPVVNSIPARAFQNVNIPPQLQASSVNPPHQAHSRQSPYNQQPFPNQQYVLNPQPVFIPQPMSNPTQPSQQAAGQQPLMANQQQSVAYPQPSVANQQQPMAYQQPSVANQQQPVAYPQPSVANHQQPVAYQQPSVANQQQPLAYPQPSVANQQQPVAYPQPLVANQQQPLAYPQPSVANQQQPLANQQPSVANQQPSVQSHQAPSAQSASTPIPSQVHTVYTPMGNVPLVTIPVYAGIPGTTISQSTSEKKKTKTSAQKPTRDPQDAGGTTIYITPTKRRGRYYVLDDDELGSTGMEEEYYFRRTPRGSSSKGSSFIKRKSRESKHAFNSSLKEAIDLEDALKIADKLNRSSHRMLSTVRADVSNSDFL